MNEPETTRELGCTPEGIGRMKRFREVATGVIVRAAALDGTEETAHALGYLPWAARRDFVIVLRPSGERLTTNRDAFRAGYEPLEGELVVMRLEPSEMLESTTRVVQNLVNLVEQRRKGPVSFSYKAEEKVLEEARAWLLVHGDDR